MKLALVLSLVAFQAGAQACGDRKIMIERLASKYGETQASGGLQSDTKVIEVWSSPKTGTFTILLTTPDGRSCIVSAGTAWTTFDAPLLKGPPV